MWAQAVAKAGATDPKKVMDPIKTGSYEIVIGKLQYDSKGDIKQLDDVSTNGTTRAAKSR